jgi:hypothetical protein
LRANRNDSSDYTSPQWRPGSRSRGK